MNSLEKIVDAKKKENAKEEEKKEEPKKSKDAKDADDDKPDPADIAKENANQKAENAKKAAEAEAKAEPPPEPEAPAPEPEPELKEVIISALDGRSEIQPMGDDAVKGYIVKALEELDENETPKLDAPAAVVAAPPKPTPPPPPCPDKIVEIQMEEPAACPHADPQINIVS